MLFKRKKAASPSAVRVFRFINTEHFRGFKRFRLVTEGYAPIQQGIDSLKIATPEGFSFNLSGLQIDIVECEGPLLQVYVGGRHIGTYFIYNSDDRLLYDALLAGRVSQAHVRIEYAPQNIAENGRLGKIKIKSVDAFRSYLFVKFEV